MEEYDENECCVIKSEASRVRTVYEWLARRFENMTAKEALLFRGAMQIEQPQATCDVMQIANQLEHYELLYGAGNDFALGKSMPKGSFIVAKTGVHPMKVKLRLFLDWGIRFGEPYEVPEKAQRAVAYADKQELEESIIRRHYGTVAEEEPPQDVPAAVGGMNHGMQAEKNSRKTILRP